MVLNKEYCLLLGVTVLEVILFQQVFVNLILDINHLKVMQAYVEHLRLVDQKYADESNVIENTGFSSYILNFSSAFNFCLSFIYLLCIYIAMSQTLQTTNETKKSFARFCGDFVILNKLVSLWYIFKITFCLFLFIILLVNTSISFTDSGHLLSLLLASFGNIIVIIIISYNLLFPVLLCLNQRLSADLSQLAVEQQDETRDISYQPLSTEDQEKII